MVKCPGCGEENPPKFRLCGYCGTPLAAAPAALPVHEVRKTVTIVFSDLKGSTALGEQLDPEALHEVKERYFNAMAAEIARHGGKVEKYIGDAIMAVFGLPKAHEDDALRAVRSAVGMREALARVNADLQARYGVMLANRTGVNTGEVVANDDPKADQKLATGDAVNVAARLEQAAPENEVYLGEVTWQLVRDAVEVEAVEPLELKGKAQRVPAFRLVSARGLDGNVRRVDTPIVGRDAELAAITQVYREVVDGRSVRLVTVFGDAGAGKSRLVHEVVERIAAGARVLRGRCLAYGEGITFWPLRVMLGAAGIRDDDTPDAALVKLMAFVGDKDVVDRLAAVVGLSSASFPMHETYWAARRVLEILSAGGPVVALVDDIHWAEGAFLDLLEHVLDNARDVPILLLATSRHDLREDRPQWGERERALNVLLRPLDDAATAQVVSNLLGNAELPAEVTQRIVEAAEGNPLYVEQMLSMLIDGGALRQEGVRWVRADDQMTISVPPTIHALLEARLDRLGRAERAAVEPAAVIGLEFAQPAVRSLVPEPVRPDVQQHLTTLTAKQFIRVSRAVEAEPIYRFQHQLVRDTVYNGLLKRARATLHIEFVRWADKVNADRDRAREFEEILGYHLEQATLYLRELGPLDDLGIGVARDAARRLGSAGSRVFARGDLHAAANLLGRSLHLLGPEDPLRAPLLPEYAESLVALGDFESAGKALNEAESAPLSPKAKAACQTVTLLMEIYAGKASANWSEEALVRIQDIQHSLASHDAPAELATAWRLAAGIHSMAGHYGAAGQASKRSADFARRAGNPRLLAKVGSMLASNAVLGPQRVDDAIGQCEQLLADGLGDRMTVSAIACSLAQLKAMAGQLDDARTLYRRSRATLKELGEGVIAASTGLDVAFVELHGGDLSAAELEVKRDYEFLAAKGESYYLPTIAALLSRVVRDQGRDIDAMVWSRIAEESTQKDDLLTVAVWQSVRAPMLARAGQIDEALRLSAQSVAMLQDAETPGFRADALFERSAVLHLAGLFDESLDSLQLAASFYEAKGNVVGVTRARESIARLRGA